MAVKKLLNATCKRPAFLSRLCGGEGSLSAVGAAFTFLSRLCGGEDISFIVISFILFLSRLCGGEDKITCVRSNLTFLSRLCGGEEEFYPKKSSYSKAYQVKIPFLPYIFCLDITD